MIRTIIIEDEYRAADRLERLVLSLDEQITILDKLDSVETAVEWFTTNPHPDLLFLDIQLADGLSFEIFDQVKVNSFVIFTTAYDEYAIRAFELNSIDYLLKPVDIEKLNKSLQKFKCFATTNTTPNVKMDDLMRLLSAGGKSHKKRFVVNVGTRIKAIETTNVAWFISAEKNTFLVAKDGHRYSIDFSLDRIEELVSPDVFFRINRQYIVGFEAIQNISVHSKSRIKLDLYPAPDEMVMVSTNRSPKFREWLDK